MMVLAWAKWNGGQFASRLYQKASPVPRDAPYSINWQCPGKDAFNCICRCVFGRPQMPYLCLAQDKTLVICSEVACVVFYNPITISHVLMQPFNFQMPNQLVEAIPGVMTKCTMRPSSNACRLLLSPIAGARRRRHQNPHGNDTRQIPALN